MIYTFKDAPLHSFLYNPQRVAKTIVRPISIPHDVKVKGPILLFPIPKSINWMNQRNPADNAKR